MTTTNDGGPAFPTSETITERSEHPLVDDAVYTMTRPGMSLRDYFAAAALPWCLSEFGGNAEDQVEVSAAAYQIADAMLAERARKEAAQ